MIGSLSHSLAMAAVEIDRYRVGYSQNLRDLPNLKEVSTFLKEKREFDPTEYCIYSYAIRESSELGVATGISSIKEIKYCSELNLEMSLLRLELEDLENLSEERLKNLRNFFISLSRYVSIDEWKFGHPFKRYATAGSSI